MNWRFRCRSHAPEAVDLGKESEATKKLYGIGEKHTDFFGKQCLTARRMVERGVRFIQLYTAEAISRNPGTRISALTKTTDCIALKPTSSDDRFD
jgi:hypothetical protein